MTPKFRVWNEKTESFIDYGDLMLDLKNGKVYSGDVGIPEYTIDVTNQVILMQSTGLKDKNGVEIYEGDILYHPLQGVRKVFYPYSESVASYGLREVSTGFGSTLQDAHAVWQVIGNIYQNQELLETKPYSEESEEE